MLKFVKVWTDQSLTGSIRKDLTAAERSIWYELLLLAGKSRREGYLEYSKGIPFTENDIARMLEVGEDLVNSAITKCLTEGRVEIVDGNTYHITHWEEYQRTEAQRKEVYGKKKLGRAKAKMGDLIILCSENPEVAYEVAKKALESKRKMTETQDGIQRIKDNADVIDTPNGKVNKLTGVMIE